MRDVSVLYPSIAMALWSLGLLASLGVRRAFAVRRGEISMDFYRSYRGAETEPEALHVHGRHVHNQFELPPLAHLALVATYATGTVSPLAIGLGWLFFGTRCLHTLVHLTSNTVGIRFALYDLGLVAVIALWVRLAVVLAGAG